MKKYYHFFSFKWIFPVLAMGLIICVYWDVITTFFTFDINAPDLANVNGDEIKQHVINSMLSYDVSLFNFSFYQSFALPIIILITVYNYYNIKNRMVKYNIGKNKLYSGELLILKSTCALIPVVIFLLVYLTVILVSAFSSGFSYSNLETDFSNDSILSKIIINPVLYAIFYGFIKSISIFINGIFACYLVDVMKSFIKGALFFVLFLWVLSPILYYFLPFEFVPMTSLMITSYSNLNIIQIFSPYLIYIAVYLVSKCVVSYEV